MFCTFRVQKSITPQESWLAASNTMTGIFFPIELPKAKKKDTELYYKTVIKDIYPFCIGLIEVFFSWRRYRHDVDKM